MFNKVLVRMCKCLVGETTVVFNLKRICGWVCQLINLCFGVGEGKNQITAKRFLGRKGVQE